MEQTVPVTSFDENYAAGDPPWVIGGPQPVVDELERAGEFRGAVLDIGCGTGEHTILLARRGHDVVGADAAPNAVERARANAAGQGVAARFELADALDLPDAQRFDTVLDSALFHVFGPDDQRTYARSLHRACRPGAVVHVLALSEPGLGPAVSREEIAAAFTSGWELESVEPSRYRGVAKDAAAARLQLPEGSVVDAPAWHARARRR